MSGEQLWDPGIQSASAGIAYRKNNPDYPFAPGDSRPETPHFKINNLILTNEFLEEIKPLAEEKQATLSQLVIQWTLQQPGISVALVGARDEAQVIQNAGAMQIEFSEEELKLIEQKLGALVLDLS